MNHTFIKGLELGELFYTEAVKPILAKYFADLTYSAALIGTGSEVLGFDTPQSMDHDWGPRLMLFLTEADHETYHNDNWAKFTVTPQTLDITRMARP